MLRSDRGAAVVEFALVVPILIVLVMGIAEFGRAYVLQSTLSGAAREGVRMMAIANPPATGPATAKTAVKNYAPALGITDAQIGITTTAGAVCPTSGVTPASATVTITYPLGSMTGMFDLPVTLIGKGVMRCNG